MSEIRVTVPKVGRIQGRVMNRQRQEIVGDKLRKEPAR